MKRTQVNEFEKLSDSLEGDLFFDDVTRKLYATDASAYREIPVAVARPKNNNDILTLIEFARNNKTTLIPRTAGTSLAGQVVGKGVIVDVSKYMTEILEINEVEKWVRVQPGVVLDELNIHLKEKGLFFGPETSTANRCMIGGMVGNNACGAHSLVYGSTRDHTISVKGFLSDGSEVEFGPVSKAEFEQKTQGDKLENTVYKHINNILSSKEIQQEIIDQFPDASIKRRNTGYAIDLLLDSEPFGKKDKFNFSKLIAGSEGTLMFITEIKLNLVPLPPAKKALVCVHCNRLDEVVEGNLIALKHKPGSIELMDDIILDCTKENISQAKNRFFVKGDPKFILIAEFASDSREEIMETIGNMEQEMKENKIGYHYPVVEGDDIQKVWALRKAGLGLLSNLPGDAKPAPVIEDTAVSPEKLGDYLTEFKGLLDKHNLNCVFYAHIATGELHLRPVLNLKDPKDVELFHAIALDTAKLVKKYKGSLSGEHGDGRLRGEFIPIMAGEKIYDLFKELKNTWDPDRVFNANKIVDTPKMNTSLRYTPGQETRKFDTVFNFSETKGILRLAEKCNGSGDCRKTELIGGTMCPSYQATRDENATTRARANILREFLTNSNKKNAFNHKEIYQVMDLCLSCKACKSECPSNVDVAKLKAEFLQHYYDSNGIPLRTRLIAYITKINSLGAIWPKFYNFFLKNKFFSNLFKKTIGFAIKRSIPVLYKCTLRKWASKNLNKLNQSLDNQDNKVALFVDEFTNYNDTEIGIKAIKLLNILGYHVSLPKNAESGRTYLSKGLLRTAQKRAMKNIELLKDQVSDHVPLIGIEPSAILAFRDEYPDLTEGEIHKTAIALSKNALMFDEFISLENDKGYIDKSLFTKETRKIKLHGHCQQKAIASTEPTKKMLTIPENYMIDEIKSGCCGMAGSFGYEKEHYDVSMKVGELVLFPAVRAAAADTIIVAPGTSCRHQIKDGTDKEAKHPVEVLYDALLGN